jgi:hypothetical protein
MCGLARFIQGAETSPPESAQTTTMERNRVSHGQMYTTPSLDRT